MVHVVLAIISLVMGTAIGWLGWKGMRGAKAAETKAVASAESVAAARGGGAEENAEKQPQEA